MATLKPKKKNSDIVTETIKFDGDEKQHVLKTLFDGEDVPTLTSIGYMGIPGTNKFVSYIIKSKGREIINIEVGEPDFRAIAEDEAKVNFVSAFMAGAEG
jgi:hypothetical protein